MTIRVQVILEEKELSAIRQRAKLDKLSVSAWMRAAAQAQLAGAERRRFRTAAELKAFFKACSKQEQDQGREPDWDEHLATMDRSRHSRS